MPVNRRVSKLVGGWRTGLSRPVLILQGETPSTTSATGRSSLEIIYLHQIRGFSTATADWFSRRSWTAAIVTPPTGALVDLYSAKAIVVAGSWRAPLLRRLRLRRPWQAFACSIVGGAGFGAQDGQPTLMVRLIRPEQRASPSRSTSRATSARFRRDRRRLHRRSRAAAEFVPNSISSTLSPTPDSRSSCLLPPSPRAETVTAIYAITSAARRRSRSAIRQCDRTQHRARCRRPHILLEHPVAVCRGPHTGRPRRDRSSSRQHVVHRDRADPGGARRARMRRTSPRQQARSLNALLAVLLMTLIHSELAATGLLAGVAIAFAIGDAHTCPEHAGRGHGASPFVGRYLSPTA